MTQQRSLRPAELAEMEAGFTKWLNMEDIGHDKYGAFIAGYMLGRMSELPPDEPPAELTTKLRELAEAQTDLDPEARNVLYSRMRELYLKIEPVSLNTASADPLACLHPVVMGDDGTGKKWCYTCGANL